MTIQEKIDGFNQTRLEIEKYEDSLKFLSIPNPLKTFPVNSYYPNIWKSRVSNDDSYEMFKAHYTNPNDGHSLVSEIWAENGKAFKAKDSNLLFVSDDETKKPPTVNLFEWWKSEGYAMYQTEPNAFGLLNIVDGNWVIQRIPSRSVMYFSDDANHNAQEIVYKVNENLYIYLAAGVYSELIVTSGRVTTEIPKTPYIQSVPFWHVSNNFIDNSKTVRSNVMKTRYEMVSDFAFDSVMCKINGTYLQANVVERVVPTNGCQYSTLEHRCSGGFLVSINDVDTKVVYENGAAAQCPECRKKIAPGTEIRLPINTFLDKAQIGTSIAFKSPDPKAVIEADNLLKAKRRQIFGAATGKGQETDVNKNFNSELSIVFASQSQRDVLQSIQNDIAASVHVSARAIAEAFGFKDVVVLLGENFVLHSTEQLLAIKEQTDKLGLTQAMRIDEQLVESAAKGIESEKRRGFVIMKLNYILGVAEAARIVTLYEIEKRPILETKTPVNEQVKEILTFAESNKPATAEIKQETKPVI